MPACSIQIIKWAYEEQVPIKHLELQNSFFLLSLLFLYIDGILGIVISVSLRNTTTYNNFLLALKI